MIDDIHTQCSCFALATCYTYRHNTASNDTQWLCRIIMGCDKLRLARHWNPIFWLETEPSHPSTLNMCAQVCSYVSDFAWLDTSTCLLIRVCWLHPIDSHPIFVGCSWLKDWKMIEYHIMISCPSFYWANSFPTLHNHYKPLPKLQLLSPETSGLRALGSLATLSTQRVRALEALVFSGYNRRFETHRNPI